MKKTPSEILQEAVDKYNDIEGGHSKYPPSGAKRWCNCPGSVALSEGEDDGANEYTAEGSLAHEICALTLTTSALSRELLEELVGDTYMIDGFEIEVTEEMVEAVILYVKTIVDDMKAAGLTNDNYGSCLSVEKKVTVTHDCDGTSDCYLAVPFEKLVVYDFKYGAGVPVDVKDNYQMKCYAVGAMCDYERGKNSYMDDVELVIIQPRARHKDGFVRRWNTTRDDILKFQREIAACVDACKSKDAPFKSGDWCRWCPGKHRCPSLFNDAEDTAKQAFDVIDTGQDILVAMTDKQMIKILDVKDTLTGYLKAVEAHALARLKSGDPLAGYKLVRGRSTRSWYSQDNVESTFEGKLSGDDLYTKKFVSPAQMEKLLKSKGVCKTEKKAKEYIFDLVDPGEGKISIAPEHDKREALMLNAGDYFKEQD